MSSILMDRLKQKDLQEYKKETKKSAPDKKRTVSFAMDSFSSMEDEPQDIPKGITLDDEELRQIYEMEDMLSEEKQIQYEKRKKKWGFFIQMVLSMACIYILLLIYGLLMTEYRYDSTGKIYPMILSVEDIAKKNEYGSIAGFYYQTRNVYEKILTLDYRVASGIEDTMAIAPEYEMVLEQISGLAVQIDAASISSQYNQVKNMLLNWVQVHSAAYCQYMSGAISQNDSAAAAEAIACREVVYSDFALITKNMIILGNEIKNYDVKELAEWSPEGYVQHVIEGVSE